MIFFKKIFQGNPHVPLRVALERETGGRQMWPCLTPTARRAVGSRGPASLPYPPD